jgi:apolipoprotein N-acyltransferase
MNSDLAAFIVFEILGLLLTVSSGALLVYLPQGPRKESIVYRVYRTGSALSFYSTLVGVTWVLPSLLDARLPVGIMVISLVALFGAFVLSVLSTRAWVRRRVPGAEFPPSPTRSKGQRSVVNALINRIKDL